MAITKLGASHLASDGYDVQRTNNFEFVLSGLGNITKNANHAESIKLAVDGAFLPAEDSSVQELAYSNTSVKVAGTTTYGSGTLTLKDLISEKSNIEDIVRLWRKAVYDPDTDKVGLAFNYKIDARVVQYAPDGTMERTWKLMGCWPTSVDYGQLQYGSGGAAKTISVGIAYDKAVRVF